MTKPAEILIPPTGISQVAAKTSRTAEFFDHTGYEFDGFRPGAYHYRDWVIRALNDDLPYDQFVRMQLVGDKSQADEFTGAAATGFLVAGP